MKLFFKIISAFWIIPTGWLILVLLSLFGVNSLSFLLQDFSYNLLFFPIIPFVGLLLWWTAGKMDISFVWKKLNKILGVVSVLIFAAELFILFFSNSPRY